jgi:hypothetical protein
LSFSYLRDKWGSESRLATLCVAAAFSLPALAKEPSFEEVFSAKGEPAALHYEATFAARDGEHRLEVWRDGDRRLKRRTDESVETYVSKNPGDAEFRMSILDSRKRIHTVIDRTNLYRIGNFTDWFDLAHGLKHPKGEYRVAKAAAPAGAPNPVETCKWYDLTQENRSTLVCWSQSARLPLLMVSQEGKVVWRVTALDRKPLAAGTFEIHDEGYVRNNANQDIETD